MQSGSALQSLRSMRQNTTSTTYEVECILTANCTLISTTYHMNMLSSLPQRFQSQKLVCAQLCCTFLAGVNLGSWMVLEPWITPTMFFQFLGKQVEGAGTPGESMLGHSSQDTVGMDMYSFCVVSQVGRQL